ncbi:DUF192 domain-containing protein [Breoghania sp.]|uniref:DUF192 domain-containing protein n=1 Tax=Breoghania sp. TaxID=2065378 RepID=UPI002AA6D071|nr:DUF192 domain-containing protein [Breoghania sp.]
MEIWLSGVIHMISRRASRTLSAFWLFSAVFALLLMPGSAQQAAQAAEKGSLTIETSTGRHEFEIEFVARAEDRARGLMYRKAVPEGTGMLFDFYREGPVGFWMKNTYVPLDMIFIRENGAVARVEHRTKPLSEKVIPSGVPVRYVLEVVAGTARKLNIQPGDRVVSQFMSAGK